MTQREDIRPKIDLDRTGVFDSGKLIPRSDISIKAASTYVPQNLRLGDVCVLHTYNGQRGKPGSYEGVVVNRTQKRLNVHIRDYTPPVPEE